MSEKLSKISMIILGIGFLGAIPYLGNLYFSGNEIKYGKTMNIFGQNEGGFFLIYALFGLIAILFFSLVSSDYFLKLFERIKGKIESINVHRVIYILSLLVFVVVLLLRIFLIAQAPMTDDENAYQFGAKILLKGQLYLEGYPVELRPFLKNQFVVIGDKVYTQYCPGFIFLLALMTKLGMAVILNPLMAALGIIGTYLLAKEVSGSKWIGLCASVLMLVSPTYIYTASCLFANPSALVFGLFGILFIYKGTRKGILWQVGLGTVFLGYMFLIRPLSTVILGLVSLWMILSAPVAFKKKFKMFFISAIIAFIFIGILLLYFNILTGSPFKTTYSAYDESIGKTGKSMGIRHFLSGNFLNLLTIPLLRFNFWLLGWPLSILLVFFVPRGNIRKYLLSAVLGIWLIHLLWKVVGVNITGAVHYFEMIPMLIISIVAAIFYLMERKERIIRVITINFIIYSMFLSLIIYFPWVFNNLSKLSKENLTPYKIESQVRKPAIILTKPFRSYRRNVSWTFYRKNNDIDLKDDILWLNRVKDENYQVLQRHFPNRNFYILYYKRPHHLTIDGEYLLEKIPKLPGKKI